MDAARIDSRHEGPKPIDVYLHNASHASNLRRQMHWTYEAATAYFLRKRFAMKLTTKTKREGSLVLVEARLVEPRVYKAGPKVCTP
jgi:hypothetical protein